MQTTIVRLLGPVFLGALLAASATAQDFTDDVTITLSSPDIEFHDIDEATNWEICVGMGSCANLGDGDAPSVPEAFHIGLERGLSVERVPFVIESPSPTNLLYLASTGNIGIKTNSPAADLTISDPVATLRLDDSSTGSGLVDFRIDSNIFNIRGNGGQNIFQAVTQAPANSLSIDVQGFVGIGTLDAGNDLEIASATPTLRFNDTSGSIVWELNSDGNAGVFDLRNVTGAASPFVVSSGAADNLLILNNSGVTVNGSFSVSSSRLKKDVIASLDGQQVLDAVAQLPLSRWSYKSEPGVDHVGPMAEDFYTSFGLGTDRRSMSPVDSAGIALAAIQGLHQRLTSVSEDNAHLKKRNRELTEELQGLALSVADLRTNQALMMQQARFSPAPGTRATLAKASGFDTPVESPERDATAVTEAWNR